MPDCPHHEAFASDIKEIKESTTRIETALGEGAVKFGKIGVRLGIVEKIVYGGVALLLIAALTFLLKG